MKARTGAFPFQLIDMHIGDPVALNQQDTESLQLASHGEGGNRAGLCGMWVSAQASQPAVPNVVQAVRHSP